MTTSAVICSQVNCSSLATQAIVTTDGGHNLNSVLTPTTYVPTLGDGSTLFTLSTATGTYYRVGPLVFVNARCVWTAKNGATGTIQFSLPITIGASTSRVSGAVGFASGIVLTGTYLTCNGASGNQFVTFEGLSNAGTHTAVNANVASTSGEVQICVTYGLN